VQQRARRVGGRETETDRQTDKQNRQRSGGGWIEAASQDGRTRLHAQQSFLACLRGACCACWHCCSVCDCSALLSPATPAVLAPLLASRSCGSDSHGVEGLFLCLSHLSAFQCPLTSPPVRLCVHLVTPSCVAETMAAAATARRSSSSARWSGPDTAVTVYLVVATHFLCASCPPAAARAASAHQSAPLRRTPPSFRPLFSPASLRLHIVAPNPNRPSGLLSAHSGRLAAGARSHGRSGGHGRVPLPPAGG